MSDMQSNLAEFIRRLGLDDNRLDQLERRVTAAGEGIRNLWTDGLGGNNACITTFEGQIRSPVDDTPIPFASVRAVSSTSLTPMGTFLADASGNYSFGVQIPPTDGDLLLYNTGPGPRFQEYSLDSSNINRCGIQPVQPIYSIPASGYRYSTEWVYPLADTMKLQDSYYGNRDIPWVAQYTWQIAANVPIPAHGSCAAITSSVLWRFIGSTGSPMQLTISSPRNSGTGCPAIGFPQAIFTVTPRTATTAPGASTKLDITWAIAAGSALSNFLYAGAAATVRIYEP